APGSTVLLKPPGWEVDSTQGSVVEGASPLSSFLGARAPASAVVRSAAHGFGFVHRLDTPSSGLVIQATSYEGFFDLCIQRELGRLQRDYVALCHGHVTCDLDISEPILKVRGGRSQVSPRGHPASTRLKVLAHLDREGSPLSLLGLTISTGRTHQIRCHLSHVGHPVVGDGMYGPRTDPGWCARHFLHRYRLGFRDLAGAARSAAHALPADLRAVLAGLRALRGGRE
ncbi:unnamed protein product, partial [Prorocentrum cordatum]